MPTEVNVATKRWFDIDRAAELAMLSLSAQEKALFSAQIEQVLAFVDTLPPANEIGTSERVLAPLREDAIEPSMPREALLANTKQIADGLIVVPRIVGGEE